MSDPIHLYAMAGSPYVRRVEMVLVEKDLAYEKIVLCRDAGELKSEAHLARSPHGKVPALVDGEVSLYESQAIVEYLEDAYPIPALLPGDAAGRASVRIEEIECQLYFMGAMAGVVRLVFMTPADKQDPNAIADALETLAVELDRLEARAQGHGGNYVLGAALTRADLTWLASIDIAERGRLAVTPARFPWVCAWRERLKTRPSCDSTYPPGWR
jgi:glutathione S-transferase